MADKLRIGIVGLGNISTTHARAINALPDAELCSAFSRSEDSLKRFGDEFDVPLFSQRNGFLSQPDLHAVAVCTPTGTHLEIGRAAAMAGKHLIIEKPIEVTSQKGKELIRVCRGNSVQLAVIYQNRFSDSVLSMKNAIESGAIGKPVMARGSVKWFRDQHYYSGSDWRGTFALDGGGAVMNQSIHTIDLLWWLMGDVDSVSAYKATLTHPQIEAEDNAVAVLRFKSGALGVFEASTSITPAEPRTIEIHGDKGTAILKGDDFQLLSSEGSSKEESSSEGAGSAHPLAGLGFENHRRQYAEIVRAILSGHEPVVSGQDSLQSLAIAEAIYRSADELRAVSPSEILSE